MNENIIENLIQFKEIKGFYTDFPIIKCVFHDDILFFCNKNNNIFLFDLQTLSLTTLQSIDKQITGDVTSLSISPSHSYAVIGYSCGSLQFFDLTSFKILKVLYKFSTKPIDFLGFQNDNTILLIANEKLIYVLKIVPSLFSLTIKDSLLATLTSSVLSFGFPLINRFLLSGEQKSFKCIAPNFQDIIFISCFDHFYILNISNELKVIKKIPINNSIFSTQLISNESLLLSIVDNNNLLILNI